MIEMWFVISAFLVGYIGYRYSLSFLRIALSGVILYLQLHTTLPLVQNLFAENMPTQRTIVFGTILIFGALYLVGAELGKARQRAVQR